VRWASSYPPWRLDPRLTVADPRESVSRRERPHRADRARAAAPLMVSLAEGGLASLWRSWPQLTKRLSDTHKRTEQERDALSENPRAVISATFAFRQGLSHRKSVRFWPFRTRIDRRRKSGVFRYLTDAAAKFSYAYQKALSLVEAEPTRDAPSPRERGSVACVRTGPEGLADRQR
jgi:hypothetical protein